MAQKSLAALRAGQSAQIISLDALPAQQRQKLLDLGLTRGEQVTLIQKAPLGDPLWLAVRGYELALRRELAQHIIVEPARRRPRQAPPRDRAAEGGGAS